MHTEIIPLGYFLLLAAFLFCLGLIILLTKKNAIMVLMGIELMFNAANLNLVAFSRNDLPLLEGQMAALFIMIIAVAEAAVALAIIIQVYRYFHTIDLPLIGGQNS